MSHIPVIQSLYAAFASGDAAIFLSAMSDDVSWEHWENNSAQHQAVPYMQARRGKAGVGEFLASLSAIDLKSLEVLNLMEGGNQVAVTFRIEFDVKATGKRLRDEEIHLWTLDAQGRVLALRHYIDTAKHIAANSG
ncbi:MAG TPA: nuclear transport factor 2 family protein [Polyangiaceae bacterium]|nr:nuclear transport factor 2 family protein [Polyangiaceae bacterium]